MKKNFVLAGLAFFALTLCAVALPVSAADHGPAVRIDLIPQGTAVTAGTPVAFEVFAVDAQNHQWDVSSATTVSIPEKAGGTLSGLVYTTEVAGSWTVTATAGDFTDTSSLIVTQGEPVTMSFRVSDDSVVAGNTITLTTTYTDKSGNAWDATGITVFSTNETSGSIFGSQYTPIIAGSWTITAKAGAFEKTIPIGVTPADGEFVTISPYPGPVVLNINEQKQFTGTVTDKYKNVATDKTVSWKTDDDGVVAITENGLVTAKKRGMTTVTGAVNGTSVSIPVEVKGPSEAQTAPTATNQQQGAVLGESVANTNTNTDVSGEQSQATPTDTTDENEETCEPIALWLAIVIMVAYAAILAGYYFLIRKEDDSSWWIFPILLTAIGVIFWSKYFCDQSYPWWPWILILVGVAVTWVMRKETGTPPSGFSRPSGDINPPDEKQPPMF